MCKCNYLSSSIFDDFITIAEVKQHCNITILAILSVAIRAPPGQ